MSFINDLSIQISLSTLPITQQGFGLPLVTGERADTSPICKQYGEYADLTEMVAAGFTSSDPEYKMVAAIFSQSPRVDSVAVYIRDSADTIADAMNELRETHDDWYIFMITERDSSTLHDAGTWADSVEKIFIGCCSAISALTERNGLREAYLIHNDAANFPEAAWVGSAAPYAIGSISWKWCTPAGVTASNFTLTELNQIRTGNGQTFSKRSGVIYSDEGKMTGGQFIDVIQARDFVKARLGEALFGLFVNNKKVPFDNTGANQIEAAMRDVFDVCGKQGIIAVVTDEADMAESDAGKYMYKVSVPSRSEVPQADRAARVWSGITFSFVIQGAIHKVAISGVITV